MKSKFNIAPELAVDLPLSLDKLIKGDEVANFDFPLTETEFLDSGETEFNFKGKWSHGYIEDYHDEGAALVRNRCYQTSMTIDSSASGGPFFSKNVVAGINSSGLDAMEGETPLSFVTPIDYYHGTRCSEWRDGKVSIKELASKGYINIASSSSQD